MFSSATPKSLCIEGLTPYDIISRIWPSSRLEKKCFSDEAHEKFLEFTNEELNHPRRPSKLAIQTLDATLNIVHDFRKNRNKSRRELFNHIRSRFLNVDDQTILDQMEIAARLLLTLHVHSEPSTSGAVDIHVDPIIWQDEQTIDGLVEEQIKRSCGRALRKRDSAIDENFTMTFLLRTCGVKIYWTNNLADHLKFNKRTRRLNVYQHKVCLQHHLDSTEEPIIPEALLVETLDTFEVLFPWHDKDARKFLRDNNKPIYGLGRCGRKRIPDIEHYVYWGHRLSDLLDIFEDPPRDIWQLLKDQRNFNQWATFWVALSVIVLTVVSIVAGTVSTVYSIKQYNLALAQACTAENAANQLPGYCS